MNLAPVYTAIIARIKADTGSGGIWATGAKLVDEVRAMPATGIQPPYIAVVVYTAGKADGFGVNLPRIEFQLHVLLDGSARTSQQDRGETVCGRLYGDGQRTPVFGFHRHTLTLASGDFTGMQCEWISTVAQHDDEDILHWVVTFGTYMHQASA